MEGRRVELKLITQLLIKGHEGREFAGLFHASSGGRIFLLRANWGVNNQPSPALP